MASLSREAMWVFNYLQSVVLCKVVPIIVVLGGGG